MQQLNQSEFEKRVLADKEHILVDFFSPTCQPCRMLDNKVFPQLTDLNIVKVNAVDCPELAQKYKINAVPALIMFKNGEEVSRKLGYVEAEVIRNMFS